jgi:hypothetical protein
MTPSHLCFVFTCLVAGNVFGAVFQPDGVSPGDTYHLIFSTSGMRDATAGTLELYDSFVNAESSQSELTKDASWSAIMSLRLDEQTFIHARESLVVSGPVYNLAGQLVSDVGLWDIELQAAPNFDQFGRERSVVEGVATGTNASGYASFDAPPYSPRVTVGSNADLRGGAWVDDDDQEIGTLSHFYALSAPITAVPEPMLPWQMEIVIGAIVQWFVRRRN